MQTAPQGIPVDESQPQELSDIYKVQLRMQAIQIAHAGGQGSPAQRLQQAESIYRWLLTGEVPKPGRKD